jgi:endonuclease YncB( thermonuclease family)
MKLWSFFLLLIIAIFARCSNEQPPPIAPPPPVALPTIFDFIERGDSIDLLLWLGENDFLEPRNDNGETPLHAAIRFDRTDFTVDLVGRGVDVNARDKAGNTPLHVAALHGRTPAVSLLIGAGADMEAVNEDGLAAYDLANLAGHDGVAAILGEARLIYVTPPEVAEPIPAPEPEPEPVPPALLLSTDFRTWTDVNGVQIEAAYIQNIFETVVLQNREGEFFRIQLSRLAPEDQATVRKLAGLDPHALARNRGTARPATPRDSIALRIGKEKGWSVLEGARLIKSSGNDGDSFHVMHEDKEHVFRLYFVDTAETDTRFPERIREQAKYFELNDRDTLALGKAASDFTKSVLANRPFTVVTRWQDARGSTRLGRSYAMIVTDQGDLDELLVSEGLARRYGMPVGSSAGRQKQSELKKLEEQARQSGAGAWGR